MEARRLFYDLAGRSIEIAALDIRSADLIENIFAEWYLVPEIGSTSSVPASTIRIRTGTKPPLIPTGCNRFEIADGICHSKGSASYLEIDGSLVILGESGLAEAEVWVDPSWNDDFSRVIRAISYAVSSALRRCGLFELHSAAVVEPTSGEGVLIVGPSGSGKSTLTTQLSADGWPYLSDDVLVLGARDDETAAWPLRRCFAVTRQTVVANGLLQTQVSLADFGSQEKARFSPQDIFISEFKESCTPRTLFFSQVTRAEQSGISQLSSGEMMARLIRISPWACYDKSTAREHLSALARLVRQSKGFDLFAGRDLLVPGNSSSLLASYVQN